MDYIEQMEKLFKFMEFSLELEQIRGLYSIKRNCNNDLNLFGCFIKDYLTVVNNKISDDESLYNDFVIYFENAIQNSTSEKIVNLLVEYSKYYLWLVFENPDIDELKKPINTINSCFAIDFYPCVMRLIYDYINQKIDGKTFSMMLQLFVEKVISRFEYPDREFNLNDCLNYQENFERLAG